MRLVADRRFAAAKLTCDARHRGATGEPAQLLFVGSGPEDSRSRLLSWRHSMVVLQLLPRARGAVRMGSGMGRPRLQLYADFLESRVDGVIHDSVCQPAQPLDIDRQLKSLFPRAAIPKFLINSRRRFTVLLLA